MTTPQPGLLRFLHELVSDGAVRRRFVAEPDETLAAHGVGPVTPDDVYDALVAVENSHEIPPPPPPAYFAERDAHGAVLRYLDNYLATGFDDVGGPFAGSDDLADGSEQFSYELDPDGGEPPGHDPFPTEPVLHHDDTGGL